MNKLAILGVILIAGLSSKDSFGQESEGQEEAIENQASLLSNTSSPDVTLTAVDATTAWGVYIQDNDFHVFRCNGDTGECEFLEWPSFSGDSEENE